MNPLDQIANKLAQKNYSVNTQKVYLYLLRSYFKYCHQYGHSLEEGIDQFMLSMIKKGYSTSTQNQAINAYKFYMETIFKKERLYVHVDRPQKEKRLPTVLSVKEVKQILNGIHNLKHHCAISLLYGCGLRIGELLNLKVRDIDSQRMVIHISQGKGMKDRYIPLPISLLDPLRQYYKIYRPQKFLFEGTKVGTPYSRTSIAHIIKRASKKAMIRKRVSAHTFRHSYATHLYELGINLRSIQVLLGHNSSKTTEIYTHISNTHLSKTPSPLDSLDLSPNFEMER